VTTRNVTISHALPGKHEVWCPIRYGRWVAYGSTLRNGSRRGRETVKFYGQPLSRAPRHVYPWLSPGSKVVTTWRALSSLVTS
jgi:hypothetical protein